MSVDEKSFGFWIVLSGLLVLLAVSVVAVIRYPAVADASAVITAAGTIIGTVVGTFFGVHVGSASAQQAEQGRQRAEAMKDTVVSGLSKVAASADAGSPPAIAVQHLIDSIKPG